MLNLMLVYDFVNGYLLTPPRIAGFCLIIIGVALAFLAKRLARVIKGQKDIENNDKTLISILTVAFVLIIGGMVVSIL